ncbi:MAG: hydantoinase/oxoprolinase family protein [Alphaproteobacteria bacterium]|nr:hydantoinase/oxoprolinase family protein [Alphaproteobacteria bacterium]
MRRIGIDVGGTNTDAVLVEDRGVVHWFKTATTADVGSGIVAALEGLMADPRVRARPVDAVMIGTTHFTNAVVQRRDMTRVGALRLGLPASASLPPFCDWPADLARLVEGAVHMVEGGHEFDGRPIMPLDEAAVARAADDFKAKGVKAVAVSGVFSPLVPAGEERAAEILRARLPGVPITLSHKLGRIGLLERENAALLNAALTDLAARTVKGFTEALAASGIEAPLYITQNDGTVARAALAQAYPVYSFASGPTNSMRGAAFLSRRDDAVVIDVGGTTADVGVLRHGFPREANAVVEVGGVRTLFRMPDLLSIGLGGGSLVSERPLAIGPRSVGYELTRKALIFGGDVLTASDVAVAAGRLDLGDKAKVAQLAPDFVRAALDRARVMLEEAIDRVKTEAGEVVLLAVGGGAFLIPERIEGVAEILRVPHGAVANAVGAAIAQVSGEADQVFQGLARDAALAEAERIARDNAVAAGAARASLKTVEVEDLPLAYLPGNALRVRTRVIGDVAS